jgi:small multidrug resistance family-3 protein
MSIFAPVAIYVGAAIAEIAGCYSVWAWLRLERSPLWLVPGVASLLLFAFLLTRIEAGFAGRAYAAYGGVYIVASLAWLWAVEEIRPDRWDALGGLVALIGSAIILFGPRPA